MAVAPPSIASRMRRRGLVAGALILSLTAAATLIAWLSPDPDVERAREAAQVLASSRPAAASTLIDPDLVARRTRLAEITTWRDLRRADGFAEATATDADLIAVDPAIVDGQATSEQAGMIERLRQRRDGSVRLVVAHLSLAIFEPGRPYPSASVAAGRPMLPVAGGRGREDRDAQAQVMRYWDAAWQGQVFGAPGALLDRLVAAGYDGVLLSDADAYRLARPHVPDADQRMAGLIAHLSTHAQQLNPHFIVMLGSGEELMAHTVMRTAVDAVVKADLLFGINGPGIANDEADIASSLHALRAAQRLGQPVFVTERHVASEVADTVRRRLGELGFLADLEIAALPNGRWLWSKVKF